MRMKNGLNSPSPFDSEKALPLLSFPATTLMGVTVAELLGSADMQAEGMKCIADRVPSAASVTFMDLSVEAEAFGAPVHFTQHEVPTLEGTAFEGGKKAEELPVPGVGEARTGRSIDALARAKQLITDRPVLAGMIGPYSLAGRLMGVERAMMAGYDEEQALHTVLEKTAQFILRYAKAFRQAGADGMVIADPLSGLLSPSFMATFAEPYTRDIIRSLKSDNFVVVYHNCGNAVPRSLDVIVRLGADAVHVGDAVNMADILARAPSDTVIMGNISPSERFAAGSPNAMRDATLSLMRECCPGHPNFVISSGCDIPPAAPWENIDAFFAAVAEYHLANA